MAFNEDIIAEFREHHGVVSTMGFGSHLVVLHTVGARTGRELENPLMGLPSGDGGILIVGSAGGSPKNPAWVHNLRANPDVTIERRGDDGIVTEQVHARELDDDEWAPAWKRFTDRSKGFGEYTKTAEGRRFPIFELQTIE
ncbi:nitroreductase/quinone reductase family protein [Gordonia sp. PP30]|uniref:nitroreductase/quinone reductase family protein n=1 Tax=unclassified Gordonia (in: high G+C Gram-positive bacteria) TaxID=2657482 RepID=UPI001FFE3726|nr:nitroreductase/quinone reductase family protein [Gordonia sp. PP30]UQE75972.1 nitroreductase/quinone reductase family protein [Gordonia sp. PP30]